MAGIGNPIVPGVFAQAVSAQPAPSQTGSTNLIVIVGTATDGVPNQPTAFSDINSLIANFGRGSLLPYSLVREAISAMPESSNFIGIRVTDTTETSATVNLLDAAAAVVLTAVAIRPGTNANQATLTAYLQSGSAAASPVYRLVLTYPGKSAEVFGGIVGYAAAGGAYNAATFIANAIAAINGTASGSTPSKNFVVSAGTSTVAPVVGTSYTASGGTDGASGVTSATLIGTPGTTATRTGANAAAGTGFNFIICAGLTDPTVVQELIAIAATEGTGFAAYAFPQGQSPTTMVSTKVANALTSPLLIPCGAWDYVFDSLSGTNIWVSPMGKIIGIIASLDPEDDPCNKPIAGAVGVNQTEFTSGQGLAESDAAQLVSNGIMYLAKPIPRGNVFGLPHGMASDGSNIQDTRMQIQVTRDIKALLGVYVGQNQTVPPLSTPDSSPDTDATRTAVRNAAKSLGYQYVDGGRLQAFTAVCDKTNNTRDTVLAKQLILNVYGETLAGISFAIAYVQVGSTVSVSGS